MDDDVREALAALIRTHRTLESGLYYETRAENSVAAEVGRRIQADTYSEFGTKAYTPYVATSLDLFVQDSCKATTKLTVDYGVRAGR